MIISDIPIRVSVSKNKVFWLNMNQYRNTHYKTTNKAKKEFEKWVRLQNIDGFFSGPVHIHYEIWPKKRSDLMNIGSILDKFLQDALVSEGILPEDNCKVVRSVSFEFKGYENPGRATAEVTAL